MAKETKKSELVDLRVPPNSKEAEDSVLGALLMDDGMISDILDRVNPDDFYDYGNRLIYQAIYDLFSQGKPADVITVADKLKEEGHEKETGGLEYLSRLTDFTPGTANVQRYAEIIRDRSIRRKLITAGNEISAESFNGEGKAALDLLDKAESKVFAISEAVSKSRSDFIPIVKAIDSVKERIVELRDHDSTSGVSTGFQDLDKKTDGFHPGELIIVAGRPSMGKTALALNIATTVALRGLPVGIFSLEMGEDELAKRLISAYGNIPHEVLKNGKLEDEHWTNFWKATQDLRDTQLLIDPADSLSIGKIRSRARKLKSRYGQLGLIVVDYLQLVTVDGSGRENRATEVAEISRGLKGLARELNVPVVALSQLSRKVEDRRDSKKPLMSDLRESGAIEQDADVILFLHREYIYNKEADEKEALLIIGKQRSGPVGEIPMVFDGEHVRFQQRARDWQEDEDYVPQE